MSLEGLRNCDQGRRSHRSCSTKKAYSFSKKETLVQVFSREFCEFFSEQLFYRTRLGKCFCQGTSAYCNPINNTLTDIHDLSRENHFQENTFFRSSRSQMFFKIDVLKGTLM